MDPLRRARGCDADRLLADEQLIFGRPSEADHADAC